MTFFTGRHIIAYKQHLCWFLSCNLFEHVHRCSHHLSGLIRAPLEPAEVCCVLKAYRARREMHDSLHVDRETLN